ncbi:hypothetical protein GCM10007049_05460 [Echinicola pacifica]|uniref:Phosphohistidine phosphatase n=1 Tax=Echinicola pacifica TaxID=346377 RepID=A0A918PMN3_9BACT|nr:hypothetical protein [Echinicola pacifica]GGZ16107.1 hypothetical protein GCM10007049_05460 [Echinicola pacifica]
MIKRLILQRHGTALTGSGQAEDFNRKLSQSGISKILGIADIIKQKNIDIDLLLCSSAVRTRQTASLMGDKLSLAEEIYMDDLYLADIETMMAAISAVREDLNTVILIGHNPGISGLLAYLIGEYRINFSPGMLVIIDFQAESWEIAMNRAMGSLVEIIE